MLELTSYPVLESNLPKKAVKLSKNIFCESLIIPYSKFQITQNKTKGEKYKQKQLGEMSFQGVSEGGAKYSSVLTANSQEKPNI